MGFGIIYCADDSRNDVKKAQNPNNKTKFSAFNFCRNIKILR